MYHKIGIQKLSPAQISKLMNGHKVRVKHGNHHHLHVSEEQHKKIMSAHKKGKAHTLQFFPHQEEENLHLRGGSFKSVMKSVGKFAKPLAKKYGPAVLDMGAQAAKSYLSGAGQEGGSFKSVMKSVGKFAKPLAKKYGPAVLDMGALAAKSYLEGAGARQGRALSGGSFKSVMKSVGKVVKPLAKKYGPAVLDMGALAAKSYLSGAGARGARGRRGRALMPAGYGVDDNMSEEDEDY